MPDVQKSEGRPPSIRPRDLQLGPSIGATGRAWLQGVQWTLEHGDGDDPAPASSSEVSRSFGTVRDCLATSG